MNKEYTLTNFQYWKGDSRLFLPILVLLMVFFMCKQACKGEGFSAEELANKCVEAELAVMSRSSAGITEDNGIRVIPAGTSGEVIEGPEPKDGEGDHIWWKIKWNDSHNTEGWSADKLLDFKGFYLTFPLPKVKNPEEPVWIWEEGVVGSAYDHEIVSVFDHSKLNTRIITAYTGEIGDSDEGIRGGDEYANLEKVETIENGVPTMKSIDFTINGNYVGAGDSTFLSYDEHRGFDYRTNNYQGGPNVPVYAAAPGKVVEVGLNDPNDVTKLGGYYVRIEGFGYQTQYLHLVKNSSELLPKPIKKGDFVERGQPIGLAGNTGESFGPHLHFEVKRWIGGPDWTPVDPYGWTGKEGCDPYAAAEHHRTLWVEEIDEQLVCVQLISSDTGLPIGDREVEVDGEEVGATNAAGFIWLKLKDIWSEVKELFVFSPTSVHAAAIGATPGVGGGDSVIEVTSTFTPEMSDRFSVGDTVFVGNTEGLGLRGRYPNATSASYDVLSDGSEGTIVGGPDNSEGYNRWKIRFTGFAYDVWCAEGEPLTNDFYLFQDSLKSLSSVSISGGSSSWNENSSHDFIATAVFSDGSSSVVTNSAVWSESSAAIYVDSAVNGRVHGLDVNGDQGAVFTASYTYGGVTEAANKTVTIIDTASSGNELELIANGDFSDDDDHWTTSGDFYADDSFTNHRSGPGYAYLSQSDGLPGNNLNGGIAQWIDIPEGATDVTLTFYYHITTQETVSNAFDFLGVNIIPEVGGDNLSQTYSNLHANSGYQKASMDLTAYAGDRVLVGFEGSTDGSKPTVFRIDDVSVVANTPDSGGDDVYLQYVSHEIDDDHSMGNNNGTVNPGEEIDLNVTLENNGSETAQNIEAVISTASPYVTITDDDRSWDDIDGGDSDEETGNFDFDVSNDCPDGHVITFSIVITSDEGEWADSFSMTVVGGGNPDIDVKGGESYEYNIQSGDSSPKSEDGTLIGSTAVGGEIRRTFRVYSDGSGDLIISSASVSAPFRISGLRTGFHSPDSYDTFYIYYEPTSEGSHQATVTIRNNDSREDPFTFVVEGAATAAGADPDAEVRADTVVIPDGHDSASEDTATIFPDTLHDGSASVTKFYRLYNTGGSDLTVTGASSSSSDFEVTHLGSSVMAGESDQFRITFNPSSEGEKVATITINSNDPDNESSYTFTVSGNGTSPAYPEIEVLYGTTLIVNQDDTPSAEEGTYFGEDTEIGAKLDRVFTIRNMGEAALSLSDFTVSDSEFTILEPTPTVVPPNGTADVTLRYSPTDSEVDVAILSFSNNVPDVDQFTFVISGSTQTTTLDLANTSRTFDSAGGSYNFTVSSNTRWTWSDNASWISSTETLSQTGNQVFDYTVAANSSTNSRSAIIVFIADGVTKTHSVTQSGVLSGPRLSGAPIAYWKMDESSGGTAADELSRANAIWQEGTSTNLSWVPGVIGNAADLGGNLDSASFFEVNLAGVLDNASALSISLWINPDSFTGQTYEGIFMTRSSVTGSAAGNPNLGLAWESRGGGSLDTRFSNSVGDSPDGALLATGGWYHIALVWDGEAGTHKQYINGLVTDSDSANIGVISDGIWHVGNDSCCFNREFDGQVDDLAIFDRPLSDEDISLIYSSGIEGDSVAEIAPEPDPVDPQLAISNDSRSFPQGGGIHSIMITSNTTWSWVSDADWVASSGEVSLTGNQNFSYSVEPNNLPEGRIATIIFTSGGLIRTHVLNQSGQMPGQILTAQPIVHWKMDEDSGGTAIDEFGIADADWQEGDSANLSWVPGVIGNAVDLGGDVDSDSFFEANLEGVVNDASALSISLWVNPDSFTGTPYEGIFMTRDSLGGTAAGNQNFGLAWSDFNGGSLDTRVPGGLIKTERNLSKSDGWHHVALVWDGVVGTHKQYINGILIGSVGAEIGKISGGIWNIGNDSCCVNREFDGKIDDLAIFDKPLNDGDIALIHHAGVNGNSVDTLVEPRSSELSFAEISLSLDDTLTLKWDSLGGPASYSILMTTDLSIPVSSWPLFDGNIPNGGSMTLITIPNATSDNVKRFFVLQAN